MELFSRRKLLRRATLSASLLLLVVPMLLPGRLVGAELGRAEEARRDFAQARAQLKLAHGDKLGHDRGSNWERTCRAESRQREAEALFQAKGIPLPEPDAK